MLSEARGGSIASTRGSFPRAARPTGARVHCRITNTRLLPIPFDNISPGYATDIIYLPYIWEILKIIQAFNGLFDLLEF